MHKQALAVVCMLSAGLDVAEGSAPPTPGVVTQVTINPMTGTGHLYLDALPSSNFFETFRHCTGPEILTSTNGTAGTCTSDGYFQDNGSGSLILSWGTNTVLSVVNGTLSIGVPAALSAGSTAVTMPAADSSPAIATDQWVKSQNYGSGGAASSPTGTWTPTLTALGSNDITLTNGAATGTYDHVMGSNCLLHVNFSISGTISYTTATGNLELTGLPASHAGSLPDELQVSNLGSFSWPLGATQLSWEIANTASFLSLRGWKSGAAGSVGSMANFPSGSTVSLGGSGIYRVAGC